MVKKQIPNLITLGNLFCGVIATRYALMGRLSEAALFICFGIVLDFFDGFAARLLKVPSLIGKELDSLADLVTSGIAPAFIVFTILDHGVGATIDNLTCNEVLRSVYLWLPYIALLIPLFAAYRLAKFNIDEEQTHNFRGLPTPANALIWVGIALSLPDLNETSHLFHSSDCTVVFNTIWVAWWGIAIALTTLVTDILMVCRIPMFSLKVNIKDLSWKSNGIRYIFLIGCAVVVTACTFNRMVWLSLSFCILWYIVLSIFTRRRHAE